MHIFDLILQIFMSATLIIGISMIVFSIAYRHRLRKIERAGRYTLGALLIYSVIIRFLITLPGGFAYAKEVSIGFDILYIMMCIFYNINLASRKRK